MENLELKMPVGVFHKGNHLNDFVAERLTGNSLKYLHDKQIKRTKPMTWIARALSLVVKEIGGSHVASEFRNQNFSTIPPIVQSIPIIDCSYILAACHVENYGNMLKNISARCDLCARQSLFTVDLSDLCIENMNYEYNDEIVVKLRDGFIKEGDTSPLGVEGKIWNQYIFEIPKLKHAIKHENLINDDIEFDYQVIASCIKGIKTAEGEAMLDSTIMLFKDLLIKQLSVYDINLCSSAIKNLPRMKESLDSKCSNCKDVANIRIDAVHFFPVG